MSKLTLDQLRLANEQRAQIWENGSSPGLLFRMIELGGEVGEAMNFAKKITRARHGMAGGRDNDEIRQMLIDELADIQICLDLVAMELNVDLTDAVISKFNRTSDKHGFNIKLPSQQGGSDGQNDRVDVASESGA